MVDILVPTGIRTPVGTIPLAMAGKVSAGLRGHGDIEDMPHMMEGRGHKPRQPIFIYGADGRSVLIVMTDGETEASELQDLAHAALAKQEDNVRKYGRATQRERLTDDERRERLWYALDDRIKRHKANPITDPPRVPEAAPAGWRYRNAR